jgi:hypothetical protein
LVLQLIEAKISIRIAALMDFILGNWNVKITKILMESLTALGIAAFV